MAENIVEKQCKKVISDFEVQSSISRLVAKDIFGQTESAPNVSMGQLSKNYYSYTFSASVLTCNGEKNVFVKIPKAVFLNKTSNILPISAKDRLMARAEESSLRLLEKDWVLDEQNVQWVTVRGMINEYSALVTDRVFAEDATLFFRNLDLRRRFRIFGPPKEALILENMMSRIAVSLQKFHNLNSAPSVFLVRNELQKFEFYSEEINKNTKSAWPKIALKELELVCNFNCPSVTVRSLKGIDIRNVLIDSSQGINLLDPGKIKPNHPEADVARFLMTYRILYWGSLLLLPFRQPDPKAERAFLRAYCSNGKGLEPKILAVFLLKEQLKHWHTALCSVEKRAWPDLVKRVVVWIYVNPFYSRQVAKQVTAIKELTN